jgi:2,4-didehydro-3-deoxy-L-rhamnonate hydrolase
MQLVSFAGGFGQVQGDHVQPFGGSLFEVLADPTLVRPQGDPRPLSALALLAPVPAPGKIICIGLNYRDHAAETGKAVPSEPVMFAKYANSLVGDHAVVDIPTIAEDVDWEAELAVVIGRGGRDISQAEALDHVAGYTCANDLSARVLQRRVSQWTRGKAIDGFLPMGPSLVTADELPDPQDLAIGCTVNGEVMQQGTTAEMVFGVAELITEISRTMTLDPGDVIITGTPHGVGIGMDPPRFLHDGDEVVVTIEGIGSLTTTIREP